MTNSETDPITTIFALNRQIFRLVVWGNSHYRLWLLWQFTDRIIIYCWQCSCWEMSRCSRKTLLRDRMSTTVVNACRSVKTMPVWKCDILFTTVSERATKHELFLLVSEREREIWISRGLKPCRTRFVMVFNELSPGVNSKVTCLISKWITKYIIGQVAQGTSVLFISHQPWPKIL